MTSAFLRPYYLNSRNLSRADLVQWFGLWIWAYAQPPRPNKKPIACAIRRSPGRLIVQTACPTVIVRGIRWDRTDNIRGLPGEKTNRISEPNITYFLKKC